jgi:hypothetical protein
MGNAEIKILLAAIAIPCRLIYPLDSLPGGYIYNDVLLPHDQFITSIAVELKFKVEIFSFLIPILGRDGTIF